MKTLVVAPHPDDEVLGVGGTLLRRKSEGASTGWLIMTGIEGQANWSNEQVTARKNEIERITELFDFDAVYQLGFASTKLEDVPKNELVSAVANVFREFEPEEVFVPHPHDVHSDHRATFNVVASCTKWFRNPSIKRVLAYETLSETEFSLSPGGLFQPNVYVNIEAQLQDKLKAMRVYSSELGEFPFPRSLEAISALATLRGATSGYHAAEAFELLRERL